MPEQSTIKELKTSVRMITADTRQGVHQGAAAHRLTLPSSQGPAPNVELSAVPGKAMAMQSQTNQGQPWHPPWS